MRALILVFFIVVSLFGENIQDQINSTKDKLSTSEVEYKDTYTKFNSLSEELLQETAKLKKLNGDIEAVTVKIRDSEKDVIEKRKSIEEKKSLQKRMIDDKKNLEIKLVEYLAKDLSLSYVLKKIGNESVTSVIQEEIFKNYSKLIKKDTVSMITKIAESEKVIQLIEEDINKLSGVIDEAHKTVNELMDLKKDKATSVENLKRQRQDYNEKLKTILKDKNNLAILLKRLKITQVDEQNKAKEDAKQKELDRQKELEKIKDKKFAKEEKAPPKDEQTEEDNQKDTQNEKNVDIRQIGSSYQTVDIAKYTGKKYSPPIDKFEIIKKFGPYVDPVYEIKIFNNSVIFKSLEKDQKVRSVLDGTIIFAKETPTLKKVVIIKHDNGMHTIYAHLDDIASVIKSGKTVPTGYVVGRVSNELVFEVTKQDKYVDPSEFIDLP